MQKQYESASLCLRDFKAIPILLVLQVSSYALLLQKGSLYDSALIPCILLICWLGITFLFRKGTSILQFIFLLFATLCISFISLVLLDLIVPENVIPPALGFILMILITFLVLLLLRGYRLIKSSPSFLFCISTWVMPLFLFLLAWAGNQWGD